MPTSPICGPTENPSPTSKSATYAIGIVAHDKRADIACELDRTVKAQIVCIDNGDLGAFGNHMRTWRTLRETCHDTEWLVVLEDDAQPVEGFTEQLSAALAVAPSPVVSLYLGRSRPASAQRQIRTLLDRNVTACWIHAHKMLHGVAIAIRTELVDDLLDTISRSPYVFQPIDSAIGMWAARITPVAYCWPSLVDHADIDTVETHADGQARRIIPTSTGIPILEHRIAWRTGTREHWDSTAVTLAL
jgi:hypothetical protein